MREFIYNRQKVIDYAKIWAFKRNPKYLNFDNLGGDCTNFASQCILAGCNVMNYTPIIGWYYNTSYDRTASWTGVEYLHSFLINNTGVGPRGLETTANNIKVGDIIQLGNGNNHFYHSPVVVKVTDYEIFVAAHTFDSYIRSLTSYSYDSIRFIHILDNILS